jgi:hypothetical protein
LRLDANNIIELSVDTFHSLPELQILVLTRNRIAILSPHLFARNRNLMKVRGGGAYDLTTVFFLLSLSPSIIISFFLLLPFFSSLPKVDLGGNPLTRIPAAFFRNNPVLGDVSLIESQVKELGRLWLGRDRFAATSQLSMARSPSNCTVAAGAVTCTCAPGHVGGALGFCVRPCSETLEHAPSGLAPMSASACPGFQLPQDLWPGGRPCVLNTTVREYVSLIKKKK